MTTINSLPLPEFFKKHYRKFPELTPIQNKAFKAGLLEGKSQLICAPTASGKTLVASMAITNKLSKGKSIYLVPLRSLANEKFKEFQALLKDTKFQVGYSTGDMDSESKYLSKYDLLVLTTEKLDSLIRHKVDWLSDIKLIVIDEIHLLNDNSRGPTLEIVLTILKRLISPQIIGLSATIGNPEVLSDWLKAELVQDTWRPVELKKGIYINKKIEFY